MSPDRRQILEQVARGELTPEEADQLLREPDDGPPPPPPDTTPSQVKKVVIRAGAGAIEIIGDPDVLQADVEGAHDASIDGDTLTIRGDADPNIDFPGVFAINLGRRRRVRIGRGITIGEDGLKHITKLRIRMNPALELDARLDAGPLSITGISGPIRARLSAGPMTVERFESPIDLSVDAGAIRAVGRLTSGDSRIRSDAGAVRVRLDPSSSVQVRAHASLGKVSLFANDEERRRFGTDRRGEATLGAGDATLRVDTAMGSVHVSVE
jgi:hypothetical protein